MHCRLTTLAAAALVTTACGGGGSSPTPQPIQAPLGPIEAEARIYRDADGGITDSLRLVVRAQEELNDVWTRAASRQLEPPPPPTVDFISRMVVVAAAGRSRPDDEIRVDSAGVRVFTNTATGDREEFMYVYVRMIYGCGDFAGDSYPVDIVTVPRFGGDVIFEENETRDPNCDRVPAPPVLP